MISEKCMFSEELEIPYGCQKSRNMRVSYVHTCAGNKKSTWTDGHEIKMFRCLCFFWYLVFWHHILLPLVWYALWLRFSRYDVKCSLKLSFPDLINGIKKNKFTETESNEIISFLRQAFVRLEAWFQWFNTTQSGILLVFYFYDIKFKEGRVRLNFCRFYLTILSYS